MDKIKENFIKLADSGKLFHAYYFFGESLKDILGFSKGLAGFLETGEFKIPEFLNDFYLIEPNESDNIGIDEIRDLRNFIYQTAVNRKKIAVIYDSGALTNEAQGALLKIIEEPPQNALIILIGSHEENLLPTINSRVHKIYFPNSNSEKPVKSFKAKKEENQEEIVKADLAELKKDVIKNSGIIKEFLNRLELMNQFNLNKNLQIRYLNSLKKSKKV